MGFEALLQDGDGGGKLCVCHGLDGLELHVAFDFCRRRMFELLAENADDGGRRKPGTQFERLTEYRRVARQKPFRKHLDVLFGILAQGMTGDIRLVWRVHLNIKNVGLCLCLGQFEQNFEVEFFLSGRAQKGQKRRRQPIEIAVKRFDVDDALGGALDEHFVCRFVDDLDVQGADLVVLTENRHGRGEFERDGLISGIDLKSLVIMCSGLSIFAHFHQHIGVFFVCFSIIRVNLQSLFEM